jgi:hypothetical protein
MKGVKNRGNAGKGRPKGAKNKRTLAKEMEEAVLRQKIKERLAPILDAQMAIAQGIKYLVWRDKASGKFKPVPEARFKALIEEGVQMEVWEEKPNVFAFRELLDRAYGKPKETLDVSMRGNIADWLVQTRKKLQNGDS